jgi:hypothetical protein
VAYYAKESSKQLASGIITLGDVGYKKLSKYCSDLIPSSNNVINQRNSGFKANGATINGHTDSEYAGMVQISSQYMLVTSFGYSIVMFLYANHINNQPIEGH